MMVQLDADEGTLMNHIDSFPKIRQDRIYETVETLRELVDEDPIAADYALAILVAERTGLCLIRVNNGFVGH